MTKNVSSHMKMAMRSGPSSTTMSVGESPPDSTVRICRKRKMPNSTKTEVIVTSAPHWTHLRTGWPAVQPPLEADAGKALALIEQIPATYVIVDAFTYPGGDVSRRYAAPALEAGKDRWRLAFTSKDPPVRVYRRVE